MTGKPRILVLDDQRQCIEITAFEIIAAGATPISVLVNYKSDVFTALSKIDPLPDMIISDVNFFDSKGGTLGGLALVLALNNIPEEEFYKYQPARSDERITETEKNFIREVKAIVLARPEIAKIPFIFVSSSEAKVEKLTEAKLVSGNFARNDIGFGEENTRFRDLLKSFCPEIKERDFKVEGPVQAQELKPIDITTLQKNIFDEYYLNILLTRGYDKFIEEVHKYPEEVTDKGFENSQLDLKIAISWVMEAKVSSVTQAREDKNINVAVSETHFMRRVERVDKDHDKKFEQSLRGVLDVLRSIPKETPDRQDMIREQVFELLKADRAYWQDIAKGRKDFGIS